MIFDKKVILVSGAASGIGAACARRFASEGALVVLGDIDTEHGNALAEEINNSWMGAAIFETLDVTQPSEWADFVKSAETGFGRVDILVSCAGICSMAGLLAEEQSTWDKTVAVNQTGAWHGMRAAVPAMRRVGGGSIVLISSIWGKVGTNGATAYQATKGALVLLAKATAAEFAADGIRANVILPGIIDTPFLNVLTSEQRVAITDMTMMKREGQADEIARAASYLASDDASYITGAELTVDGGYTAQ